MLLTLLALRMPRKYSTREKLETLLFCSSLITPTMSCAEQNPDKLVCQDEAKGEHPAVADSTSPNDDQESTLSLTASETPLTTIEDSAATCSSTESPPPGLNNNKDSKGTESLSIEEDKAPSRTFRERLVERFGADYHGVERYRLAQAARKELHWKRWGPYVSDRQWASIIFCLLRRLPPLCAV
jgi:hypothetical protein